MEILWIAVAFALGLGAHALGLPPLLGYLAGGFALSAFGVEDTGLLHELAHYGVIFLLFTLGLHIRLRNLVQPEVLGSSLLQFLLAVGILALVFAAFGMTAEVGWTGVVMLGVLLGVASTVVAAKGLEERRELAAYHGRVAIGILIVEDLILIAVLAFGGLGAPSPWAMALLALPLLRRPLLFLLGRVRHEELLLLLGLLLSLGGAALFTALGLSGEIGAFAAGVLLSGSKETEEVATRLWSLREGFLVAFFLEIGLAGLPDASGWIFALGLLLFLPIRVGIFYGLLTRFRLRARTAFFASAALASYSEFALITGAVLASAGVIPGEMVVVLALAVALSFAFGAPFHRNAPLLYPRLRPALARWERTGVEHPDAQIRRLGQARFLVLGMGRTGVAAYDYLRSAGERVIGLDRDPAVLEELRARGRRVAYGVADDPELWEELDLDRLAGVVFAVTDAETKVRAIRDLRALGFGGVITATRRDSEEGRRLEEAGATSVCHPLVEAGERLGQQALEMRPGAAPLPPALAPGETIALTPEQLASPACGHTGEAREVTPSAPGCEECLKAGDPWVHLRICMTCGHVGCCDASPNRHASKHFREVGHPIVRSLEPGERWVWCYRDEQYV